MATQPGAKPGSTISRPGAGWVMAGWLVVCLAVGVVSSIFSKPAIPTWYAGLVKGPLNPPDWVFAPVWTVLYILMAIAAWLVWETRPSPCRRRGLRFFGVQLWFNLLWSWIFFSRHQIGTALIDLLVLWIAIAMTLFEFKKMSRTATWLMVPYLAWVTFACYLNLMLWRLN